MTHILCNMQDCLYRVFEILSCLHCQFAHGLFWKRFTFKMKQNIRLVVLEHLSNKLNIHVLNIDLLLLIRNSFVYNEVLYL